MKLIYFYVEDFEPFHQVGFNFVADYICAYKDGMLSLCYRKVLPEGFYDKGNEGSLFVSAIVGPNGSGKTSFVRCLEAIYFKRQGPSFVAVVEAKGEIVVYYRLKCALRVSCDGCSVKAENLLNEDQKREFGDYGKDLRSCFTTIYFSPHYSVSTPLTYSTENVFVDLSTTRLLNDSARRVICKKESADTLFRSEELKKILRFYREAQFDLPKPKSILLRPESWLYYEIMNHLWNLAEEEAGRRETIEKGYGSPRLRLNDAEYKRLKGMLDFLGAPVSDPYVGIFKCLVAQIWNERKSFTEEGFNKDAFGRKVYEASVKDSFTRKTCCELLQGHGLMMSCPVDLLLDGQGSQTIEDPLLEFFSRAASLECCSDEGCGDALELCLDGDSVNAEILAELYSHCTIGPGFCRFAFNPQQSAGEMSLLMLYSRLWTWFEDVRRSVAGYHGNDFSKEFMSHWQAGYVVVLDEAEITLHPAWQQRLVSDILRTFNASFPGFNVHFIFATHSPVILSDIPIGNVSFLERSGSKVRSLTIADAKLGDGIVGLTNTFGANIFDLYRISYSLKTGTIGSFAAGKLTDLLQKLNGEILTNGKIDEDDIRLVKLVGDPFVSRFLWNRLDKVYDEDRARFCREVDDVVRNADAKD